MTSDLPDIPAEFDSEELEEYILSFTRLASLGLLSSAIMHEIRNSLTILSGNIQILQMKGSRATVDEMLQRLNRMMPQIERMEKIIGRVESFSRRSEGLPRQVSPDSLIENALLTLKHLPSAELFSVNHDFPLQTKLVYGDPSLLEFIILEMLRINIAQLQDSNLRIESSDHHPNWELRIEFATLEAPSILQQVAVSPGIRIAELAARKAGGSLTPIDAEGRTGWRLLLPWCNELPSDVDV